MKASLFAQTGSSERRKLPATWSVPPSVHDPVVSMQSDEDGLEVCVLAEEIGGQIPRDKIMRSMPWTCKPVTRLRMLWPLVRPY